MCWFARAQQQWIDAGNAWPGNALTDLLKALRVHECNEQFDRSAI